MLVTKSELKEPYVKKIFLSALLILAIATNSTAVHAFEPGRTHINPTPEQLLTTWWVNYAQDLDNEELQLLGNMLHTGYAAMSINSYLRRCGQFMTTNIYDIRSEVINAPQNHPLVNQLKQMLNRVELCMHEYQLRNNIWQHANAYTEQPEYQNVNNAINALQGVILAILQQQLWKYSTNLDTALEQAQKQTSASALALHNASQLYAALLNGENPVESLAQDERMAKLDTACKVADMLQDHITNTGTTNTSIISFAEMLQETGLAIFSYSYAQVYLELASSKGASLKIMFDDQGFIPELERCTHLPTPRDMITGVTLE